MPKPSFPNNNKWVKDMGRNNESNCHHKERKKVTFKSNKNGQNRDGKDWKTAVRDYMQDEDIDMGMNAGTSGRVVNKKVNKKPQRGSGYNQQNAKRPFLESPNGWYKVQLPHGDNYDRTYIYKILNDAVQPLEFWPISWIVNGTTVNFFIDDHKVARRISDLDRQLSLPNGFKLLVRVFPGFPNVAINERVKEKMKLAMAKRYNAANKSLNLRKFHADPELQEFFCVLFKPIILLAVFDIIGDNIPEVEAIDFTENRLTTLSAVKKINSKIPVMRSLNLGNNCIRSLSHLDSIQWLPLAELILDGNPLCNKYNDQATYISYVRKKFPVLRKLDGIDLPPPISFDIIEEHELPNPQQNFLCNVEAIRVVRPFLEQYTAILDSENRQPLLQAYHANACYSMTMAYPYGYGREEKSVPWLNWYATENRNLLRVQNSDRRMKLLKEGQVAIVAFLQEMPQTKHDIHSFTVDLTVCTPQMLTLTVSGMFKELKSGHKTPPLRYFFKNIVLVPAGSGFCIANEVVHISNATPRQAKEAFKTPIIAPSNLQQPLQPSPSVSTAALSVVQPPAVSATMASDNALKEEMVKQMAVQSGMNLEWSLKCLEETQWDFQRALAAFQALNSQGVVPPAAFVQ